MCGFVFILRPRSLLVCDEGHRLKNSAGNKTIRALSSVDTKMRVLLSVTTEKGKELRVCVCFVRLFRSYSLFWFGWWYGLSRQEHVSPSSPPFSRPRLARALQGTPIQNKISEFFAMADFVCPGVLGSLAAFKRAFETPIARARDPGCSPKEKVSRVTSRRRRGRGVDPERVRERTTLFFAIAASARFARV